MALKGEAARGLSYFILIDGQGFLSIIFNMPGIAAVGDKTLTIRT